jgi:hypothetical protein
VKKQTIVSEEESDEDVPDYSNWSFNKQEKPQKELKEEDEDEEFNLPDYSNWKLPKQKQKEEKKNVDLFEDVSKNKLDLFKQILEDSKKEEKFNFLNQEEDEDDEDEKLTFEEWKQKKFEKKNVKKKAEPLNLLNLIKNEETTIETNMNKEEHQKFVNILNLNHNLVTVDVSFDEIINFLKKLFLLLLVELSLSNYIFKRKNTFLIQK